MTASSRTSRSIRPGLVAAVAALSLAACSGSSDSASKPETTQSAAATAKNDTSQAASAGRDPGKLIERFDANKDGVLEVSELPPRMQQWLAKADTDKDGKLSATELRAHAETMKKEHFARLDSDKDGVLTESDVGDRRWKRLSSADTDKDGKVTPTELESAMSSGKLGYAGGGARGRGARGGGGPGRGRPAGMMRRLDANQDGALSAEEVGPERWKRLGVADADKDGKVTRDELRAARESGQLPTLKRGRSSDRDAEPSSD